MYMKKAIKVIALTLLINGLVFGGLLLWFVFYLTPESFDQGKWLSKPEKRGEIVDDLIANTDFKRMTKKEIIKLLGEPENLYFKEPNNIVYYLGNERGLISIDSEWLVFWFDEEEKVFNYELKVD